MPWVRTRPAAWPLPRGLALGALATLFRDGLQIALAATLNVLQIGGLLILFRLMTSASDQLGAGAAIAASGRASADR